MLSSGPVSTPSSMRMMVTPVQASPWSRVCCTGDMPRQRGSRLKCTLRQPCRGSDSNGSRRIWPKATTTTASGARSATAASTRWRSARPRSWVITTSPAASAAALTAVGPSLRPRPTGRSGCETTRGTSWPASSNASRHGTENSGEPMKTIFKRVSFLRRGGVGAVADRAASVASAAGDRCRGPRRGGRPRAGSPAPGGRRRAGLRRHPPGHGSGPSTPRGRTGSKKRPGNERQPSSKPTAGPKVSTISGLTSTRGRAGRRRGHRSRSRGAGRPAGEPPGRCRRDHACRRAGARAGRPDPRRAPPVAPPDATEGRRG